MNEMRKYYFGAVLQHSWESRSHNIWTFSQEGRAIKAGPNDPAFNGGKRFCKAFYAKIMQIL